MLVGSIIAIVITVQLATKNPIDLAAIPVPLAGP
jgi:hypothetical protein